ncbi:UPAR/Ly6 domain-containing protein rtv-like [Oratosquilla oratoria]|uniref:UPAR/Ly6 domain-containing protein rtv-like n=1 Tax=Oratosquilla oratoria TaxID=337810 RepID=UPI003F76CCE5
MFQRISTRVAISVACLLLLVTCVKAQNCFSCRSRGKLGDCRDQFVYNATTSQKVNGVEAVPCASGWCAKIIEGDPKGEDHDLATERKCLQRSPPDNLERCGDTAYGTRKVFMCFCNGNLCNTASMSSPSPQVFIFLLAAILVLVH